jgi:CDP-2,3-bis-(O-geranylgeranyl)-sn-glycerol synthase
MGRMIDLIITSLYFILPAYFANMMPVFAAKLRLPGGKPVSEKWLGAHKTWRGFYAGYLGALLMLAVQLWFQKIGFMEEYRILKYNLGYGLGSVIFAYAALFGFGALIGDSVKSFFKRRLRVKPGRPFFPFDQLDFILGVWVGSVLFLDVSWEVFAILLIVTPLLHFLANLIGYLVGLKKVWW